MRSAAALAARLEAGAPLDAAADALTAQREDGAALAQTAWASSMFLCNALRAPTSVAQVAAWSSSPEHAVFAQNTLRALRSAAGTAAVCAFLDHATADALEYDMWGGRGFHRFQDVPMRRSAAEFLLAEALEQRRLAPEADAALAARLAELDDVIAAAHGAGEAYPLSPAPPAALPHAHAVRWWLGPSAGHPHATSAG